MGRLMFYAGLMACLLYALSEAKIKNPVKLLHAQLLESDQ